MPLSDCRQTARKVRGLQLGLSRPSRLSLFRMIKLSHYDCYYYYIMLLQLLLHLILLSHPIPSHFLPFTSSIFSFSIHPFSRSSLTRWPALPGSEPSIRPDPHRKHLRHRHRDWTHTYVLTALFYCSVVRTYCSVIRTYCSVVRT